MATPSLAPGEASRPTVRQLASAAGLSLGIVIALWAIIPVATPGGDSLRYLGMARDPSALASSPWSYRVLVPWLAHALGGNTPAQAFHLISLASMALLGPAVYVIVRGLRGPHAAGLVAVVGALTMRGVVFYVHQPYLVDPGALLLAATAFAALVWGGLEILPLVLVVWAMTRETFTGFALPAYAWLSSRAFSLRQVARVAVLMLPAVIAWQLLLHLVPSIGIRGLSRLLNPTILNDVAQHQLRDPLGSITFTLTWSLGIWWLLAARGWRVAPALLWWLVPVFAQFTLSWDWSRQALYALPVVVPIGAVFVWSHPRRWILVGIILLQAVVPLADLGDGRLLHSVPEPSYPITLALMTFTALALWWPYAWPRLPRRRSVLDR